MATANPSMLQISLPIVASILVATGGWIFTYLHGKRAISRQADLDRVNEQLRLLYGPLYAILLAGDATWSAFSKKYWPAHKGPGYFTDGAELTNEEKARWVTWMREVFHPNNARLEEIVLTHLDLVDGGELPPVFVHVLAHIAVYRAILKQWEGDDFSEFVSVINFPATEMMVAVKPVYERLLARQRNLIEG